MEQVSPYKIALLRKWTGVVDGQILTAKVDELLKQVMETRMRMRLPPVFNKSGSKLAVEQR